MFVSCNKGKDATTKCIYEFPDSIFFDALIGDVSVKKCGIVINSPDPYFFSLSGVFEDCASDNDTVAYYTYGGLSIKQNDEFIFFNMVKSVAINDVDTNLNNDISINETLFRSFFTIGKQPLLSACREGFDVVYLKNNTKYTFEAYANDNPTALHDDNNYLEIYSIKVLKPIDTYKVNLLIEFRYKTTLQNSSGERINTEGKSRLIFSSY